MFGGGRRTAALAGEREILSFEQMFKGYPERGEPPARCPQSVARGDAGTRRPLQLWQQPAKTLVFMKLSRFAAHYRGVVWPN
jgi:hypothetical protein